MKHVLIVDDEVDTANMMATLIAAEGFTVANAGSLRDARRQIAMQKPDVLLLDLVLPDGDGMDLLKENEALRDCEVVLITGHASLETSIEALRLGVSDYVVKPISPKQLQGILSRVMPPSVLKAEISSLSAESERSGHFGHLWGRSQTMKRVYEQISRVAGTAITVLITGESGTGKELVARTIHDLSRRRKQAFLAVNCGAISPNLIESEIFGHEKGSFTGADRQHQGFFERAHGGTLFLDEVTEMLPELQVKLLRVLETGMFMRVGSTQEQPTDVRIIAATNRKPVEAVAAGRMRADLMYRLDVFPIPVPPLRDRLEDIPLLAQHFLNDICAEEGVQKKFTPGAAALLSRYHWPGNVRELRNVVQRAFVMAEGDTIDDTWLFVEPPASPAAPSHSPSQASITVPIGTSMADAERELILATLRHYNNHKERTAAVLRVSLKTLYNRLKEYSSDRPDADSYGDASNGEPLIR